MRTRRANVLGQDWRLAGSPRIIYRFRRVEMEGRKKSPSHGLLISDLIPERRQLRVYLFFRWLVTGAKTRARDRDKIKNPLIT